MTKSRFVWPARENIIPALISAFVALVFLGLLSYLYIKDRSGEEYLDYVALAQRGMIVDGVIQEFSPFSRIIYSNHGNNNYGQGVKALVRVESEGGPLLVDEVWPYEFRDKYQIGQRIQMRFLADNKRIQAVSDKNGKFRLILKTLRLKGELGE